MKRTLSERLCHSVRVKASHPFESLTQVNSVIVGQKRQLKSKLKNFLELNGKKVCLKFAQPRVTPRLEGLKQFQEFNFILLKLKSSPKFMNMIKAAPKPATTLSRHEAQTLHKFLGGCTHGEVRMVG